MNLGNVVIRPLSGVGPIDFSMTRDQVRALLGRPYHEEPLRDSFFEANFQVFYAASGTVEMVQLVRCKEFSPTLYDVPVLRLPADEVVSRLVRRAAVKSDDVEFPYTAAFPSIEVALWRQEDPDEAAGIPFETVTASVAGVISSG